MKVAVIIIAVIIVVVFASPLRLTACPQPPTIVIIAVIDSIGLLLD